MKLDQRSAAKISIFPPTNDESTHDRTVSTHFVFRSGSVLGATQAENHFECGARHSHSGVRQCLFRVAICPDSERGKGLLCRSVDRSLASLDSPVPQFCRGWKRLSSNRSKTGAGRKLSGIGYELPDVYSPIS